MDLRFPLAIYKEKMILMNNFQAKPEKLLNQEIEAAKEVIRSGWYVLGEKVRNFEKNWAKKCGVSFSIGVGNGMDAIEIGLRSLNIGSGDEVITTPMTAFATVLAIIRTGAIPVLADIDPETALLDLNSVKRCLSSKTKALLLVHLYGQIRNMDKWVSLCKEANIYLLEDCAQAHSASWKNRVAGSFGTWGAYSFYPTKNLGTIGDGGALITDLEEVANLAKVLRNYGQTKRYYHEKTGLNSRLDELHAGILSVRLQWLERFNLRRKQIAKNYLNQIVNPCVRHLAPPPDIENHVYHLFVILCKQRDQLIEFLHNRNIQSVIHYPVPVHHQSPCKKIPCDPKGLVNTENHAKQCLSIPCNPQMSDEEVQTVINVVNEFESGNIY